MLTQNPTQVLPLTLLKEATIHFYCPFDESWFWDICTIIELNNLIDCGTKKRQKQPTLYFNEFLYWIKFFHVSIVN